MPDKTYIPDVMRLSAMPFAESLTQLIYGGSGVGKTAYLGSAGPRNVIINVGVGLTTLQSPWFLSRFPFDPWVVNVPLNVNQFDFVGDSIDYLVKERRADFDVISIDDASALRRMAMIKGIGINADLQKSATQSRMKTYGKVAPEVQDYGEEMSIIEWFLHEYTEMAKQHNFHLLVTAHERLQMRRPAKIGDEPTVQKRRPGFTGSKFPDAVPAFFDETWHMEMVGKGERGRQVRFTTQPNEALVAKTRHGGIFQDEETNLDFPTVLKRIKACKYIPDPKDETLLIAVKP